MTDTLPLRRVARIVNGGTPTADESNWGGDVPWATPVDIGANHGGSFASTGRTLTPFGARAGSTIVPAASVLVSTRAPIGYVARTLVPMSFNQGCRAVVPGQRVDARFLTYALLAAQHEMYARGQGTTFSELSAEGLATVPVAVPTLDEQRRIADFLDTETTRMDLLDELRIRQQGLLTEQHEANLTAIIEESVEFSETRAVRLKFTGARVTVGIVVTPAAWYVETDGVPAIRGLDVSPGTIRSTELIQISRAGHIANLKSELRSGDLVVVRTGNAGAASVVRPELDGANAIDLLIIRPGPHLIPKFLEHIINSERTRKFVDEFSVGTIQSHFNVSTLSELPIPFFDIDHQARLVTQIDLLRSRHADLVSAITAQRAALHERRQALITAAVTGQLDVTTASGATP